MIETARSRNGALLEATIVIAVGLDQLEIAAFAGSDDLDKPATTKLHEVNFIKYRP